MAICRKCTPKENYSMKSRRAAFYRHKDSIFKYARELYTSYSIAVAIILISPYGEIFSFGCPSVNQVLDRYDRSSYPDKPEAERFLPYGIDPDVLGGDNATKGNLATCDLAGTDPAA